MTPQSLTAPSHASVPADQPTGGFRRELPVQIQIIPAEGIAARVQADVPAGTALTVSCLPREGVGASIRTAIELAYLGFEVVPHLAARSIESRAQLAGVVRNCHDAGIAEVFAVGGDAGEPAGPYDSSLRLLEDLAELSGGRIRAGVAGYPEGHPSQTELHMLDALLEKQHLASRVVTQLCFSAPRIQWYAETLRREGVRLPVWAGVSGRLSPGAADSGRPENWRGPIPETPEPAWPPGPPPAQRRSLLAHDDPDPNWRTAEWWRVPTFSPSIIWRTPANGRLPGGQRYGTREVKHA
ncbi:methylenetetrahydrofolate reductase [Arthrobacter oryzae]|uniref:methylenetetrahydrofolate reductase n=1 Tax=Arthrobacter TaxID=1663 RepID=UPI0035941253|nr:methylenetetrahydrofolate reductase [Arthrobacter sp. FW306-06-A]